MSQIGGPIHLKIGTDSKISLDQFSKIATGGFLTRNITKLSVRIATGQWVDRKKLGELLLHEDNKGVFETLQNKMGEAQIGLKSFIKEKKPVDGERVKQLKSLEDISLSTAKFTKAVGSAFAYLDQNKKPEAQDHYTRLIENSRDLNANVEKTKLLAQLSSLPPDLILADTQATGRTSRSEFLEFLVSKNVISGSEEMLKPDNLNDLYQEFIFEGLKDVATKDLKEMFKSVVLNDNLKKLGLEAASIDDQAQAEAVTELCKAANTEITEGMQKFNPAFLQIQSIIGNKIRLSEPQKKVIMNILSDETRRTDFLEILNRAQTLKLENKARLERGESVVEDQELANMFIGKIQIPMASIISPEEAAVLQSLMNFMLAKMGRIDNTQLVTDTMVTALNSREGEGSEIDKFYRDPVGYQKPDNFYDPSGRIARFMNSYKERFIRASVDPQRNKEQLELLKDKYTYSDGYGCWTKSVWSESSESSGVFIWQNSFAIIKDEEGAGSGIEKTVIRTASLDLRELSWANGTDSRKEAFEIIINFIATTEGAPTYDNLMKPIKKSNAGFIPQNIRDCLSLDDDESLEQYAKLIEIAQNFKNEMEQQICMGLIELGE